VAGRGLGRSRRIAVSLAGLMVRRLVADATGGRSLGLLGEPGVNVTELNLAVAGRAAAVGG